ncbi:hypothetical protein C8R43DRAFT_891858 [Mycena crocata]|nr:hypothetical protein C8R43DRAFT_891858 [Mycena crocata]
MLSSILVLIPFLVGINAANDWKKPCTSGRCSYDMPSVNGSSSGTLNIWGSENAITDITAAAGWEILGCDPGAVSQDIRLVCLDGPDDPNSKCAHLFQNIGAVHKIVRLPQNCGANAFARISRSWVHADQTIPASVRRRLVRRGGVVAQPVVQALALDTDFGAVDHTKTGEVHFSIMSANVPGAAGKATVDAAKAAGNKVVDVASDVADAAGDVVDVVGDVASVVVGALGSLSFDKTVNLIDSTLDCSGSVAGIQGNLNAALRVDLAATANAEASVTVAASGKVIPPSLTSFSVIAGMNANVAGTMTMTADVSGHIDSGKSNLVSTRLPGINFPGILTVGPTFKVDAQIVGDIELSMDMTVGLNFDVNNAQIAFPASAANKVDGGSFKAGDTPLTLNVDSNVQASGSLTMHLIPSINLGIDALGGKGRAQLFLALDTNAALTLTLDGSSSKTKGDPTTLDNAAGTSGMASGCVRLNGGFNLKAGVEGNFFGLFKELQTVSLYNKNFKIFEVCYSQNQFSAQPLNLSVGRNASATKMPRQSLPRTLLQTLSPKLLLRSRATPRPRRPWMTSRRRRSRPQGGRRGSCRVLSASASRGICSVASHSPAPPLVL